MQLLRFVRPKRSEPPLIQLNGERLIHDAANLRRITENAAASIDFSSRHGGGCSNEVFESYFLYSIYINRHLRFNMHHMARDVCNCWVECALNDGMRSSSDD